MHHIIITSYRYSSRSLDGPGWRAMLPVESRTPIWLQRIIIVGFHMIPEITHKLTFGNWFPSPFSFSMYNIFVACFVSWLYAYFFCEMCFFLLHLSIVLIFRAYRVSMNLARSVFLYCFTSIISQLCIDEIVFRRRPEREWEGPRESIYWENIFFNRVLYTLHTSSE